MMSRRALPVAPVLLVLTALVQIALARCGPLTPWKGGGFGLFSSVDKFENRVLLAWADDEALPLDGIATHDRRNALAFPTVRRLDRIASRLAADHGRTVRVEVWRRTFDPETGEVRRVLVASRTVTRAR